MIKSRVGLDRGQKYPSPGEACDQANYLSIGIAGRATKGVRLIHIQDGFEQEQAASRDPKAIHSAKQYDIHDPCDQDDVVNL